MIDWDEVAVNSVIALTVAFLVALYVRYKVKPKHEIVFEQNRNDEIKTIFTRLHFLNFQFEGFLNLVEKEMGEITQDRKTLTPKGTVKHKIDGSRIIEYSLDETNTILKFEKLKAELIKYYEEIKNMNDEFQKDYLRLLNHIENSLLRLFSKYFFDTYLYVEQAREGHLINHFLETRMEIAKKIIEFVEHDKTIDITHKHIYEFIEEWKKEIYK